MGFDIGSIGENAANGAVGQVLGMVLGGAQDKRQLKQQGKLQELQIKGNKEMADYSQQKQMEMWENTNYGAQKDQMNKAGINPALMYGMSGGGGVTTGAGGGAGVTGGTADGGAARTGMGLQIASQLALQKAQKENIEADTANKKAGTENTGVATETAKQSQEATVNTIKTNAERAIEEMWLSANKRTVSDHTVQAEVEKIKADAVGSMIENEAKKTGIAVDRARINEIANNIAQRWKDLELTGKNIEQSKENMEKLTEAMLWGAGIQAAGNIVRDVVGIVTKGKGTLTQSTRSNYEGGSTTTTRTTPIK